MDKYPIVTLTLTRESAAVNPRDTVMFTLRVIDGELEDEETLEGAAGGVYPFIWRTLPEALFPPRSTVQAGLLFPPACLEIWG